MKITDGTRTVEITMTGLNGVDWVGDFMCADYDEENDISVVDSVAYAIEGAIDWLSEENNEDYDVEIIENDVMTRYIIEDGKMVKLVF